jgi:hypothetical protein
MDHVQKRWDPNYKRHYYFNSVTKKSGWSMEEVATPTPAPPAAPPPEPPNPYPHIQQRFDTRYNRNYFFNSITRKSGWSMADVLEPAAPPPALAPAGRSRGDSSLKQQLGTYGKGARRRSLAGGKKSQKGTKKKSKGATSFDGDPSFELDQKAQEDFEDFYYNQLNSAKQKREDEVADDELDKLERLAANSRREAQDLEEEGRRQAKTASDLWAKKAELQAKMASAAAEDEARNRLILQDEQSKVTEAKKKQISTRANAEKEHRFAVRRRIELEEKARKEQIEAERSQVSRLRRHKQIEATHVFTGPPM